MIRKNDKHGFEIKFLEPIVSRSPDYVEALSALAEAYTASDLFEKGLEMDLRLARLCPQDPIVFYNLACSQALVRQNGEALKSLELSLKLGYSDFKHMLHDPDLARLRQEPAFLKMIEALKNGEPAGTRQGKKKAGKT